MAFGLLGDIVEGVADVFLPPKGTRGATLGGLVGGSSGAKVGAAVSQSLSSATGKSAVSTPTPSQTPQLAPETAQSSNAPSFRDYERAGVPMYASTNLPGPVRSPGAVGMGETILDITYAAGDYLFGGPDVCAATPKKLLSERTKADGSRCITVTRKQQHQLKQMVMYMGIQETASYVGLSVAELASLLVKKFPPKRKGISAAQLRNAKRVNRQIMGMAKQLTESCKTTTRRR